MITLMKTCVPLLLIALFIFLIPDRAHAQRERDHYILLQPSRVFDGEKMQEGWWVLVKNNFIEAAGPSQSITVPAGTQKNRP